MVTVELENVTKSFENFRLEVSLKVKDGELLTLLGPSGCGKTTTLRIIAGLESPDSGRVLFDGDDVTSKKPYERNVGFVFQDYALFPHMTVYENIAFGLKVRKIPRGEIERKVKEAIKLVGLEGLENRYPEQLSGGQQQRVALARALVVEPDILLLDEPLSNLDARVRERLRREIRRIQREVGITTVYVTHDQVEAMAISDRIALMNFGKIEQVGEPLDLYLNPKSEFVARFLGDGNLLEARVHDGKAKIGSLEFNISTSSKKVKIFFRPEHVEIGEGDAARVVDYEIIPGRVKVYLEVDNITILAERPLEEIEKIRKGAKVGIKIRRFIVL